MDWLVAVMFICFIAVIVYSGYDAMKEHKKR